MCRTERAAYGVLSDLHLLSNGVIGYSSSRFASIAVRASMFFGQGESTCGTHLS